MTKRPHLSLVVLLGLLMGGLGCTPSPDDTEPPPAEPDETATEKDEVLLQPFDPPPLAQIDAKAKWIDMPVVDSLKLLRQWWNTQSPAPLTAEEALSLKNDSDKANEQILATLGRLPANDAQVNWDATITRHIPADIKSANPIMVSATYEFYFQSLTAYGLFSFDWNMDPFAAAETVKRWQVSEDRMYDKVVLRDDLTWSDGAPITAHDVVFSFQTIMNPKVPVPAVRSGTDELRWVEAYDDYTLVFFHKESLPTNVWNVNFPVIPKHIYEKSLHDDYTMTDSAYHVKYENEPVTGGPYTVARRVRGQEIVFERRDSYYMHKGKQVRDKPYFKTIRFRIITDTNTSLLALKAGEIDELMLQPEQWTTQTGDSDFYTHNTKARGTEWVYFYFGWNCKSPFFQDKRVRQAMGYAYDFKEMHDKLNYGLYEPCAGIFHPTAWMAPKNPPPPYQQDLNKAEDLLDAAGWTDHDGDGIRDQMINGRLVPFEFTIFCANDQTRVAYCTLLKENLDKIGVICNVRPLEFTALMEKTRKHEFQAAFAGWGTGTDPYTNENLFKTGEGRNYGEYSNPEVDRLFAEAKQEFDHQKRAEKYGKIFEILYEDQPYTWLYYRSSFYAFNKKLRGYKYSPRGPYSYGPGFGSIWSPTQH